MFEPDLETMHPFEVVNGVLDDDFNKLEGPSNYFDWLKTFTSLVRQHQYTHRYKYTDLYKGIVPAVVKPELTKFIAPCNISLDLQFGIYELELEDWKECDKASRTAVALLKAAVKPWIWGELSKTESSDPHQAYTAIQANNKPINDDYVHAKLDEIKLQDPDSVSAMVHEFEQVYNDIGEAGGIMNRAQLVNKINKALSKHYHPFVTWWELSCYGKDMNDAVFQHYTRLIFHSYDNNKDDWAATF